MVQPRRDQRSPQAQTWRKWYNLAAWKHARGAQLTKQPLCEPCLKANRITVATIVDHIHPHKGDWTKFIDPTNHQSICDDPRWRCHSSRKQIVERRGYEPGCDASGRPIAADHPWNADA